MCYDSAANYYGLLEDGDKIGEILADSDIKYIMSCNPISLGLLKSPGEYGADIAVGEGQPLGLVCLLVDHTLDLWQLLISSCVDFLEE